MQSERVRAILFFPALISVLALCAWAYLPGLHGAFLFDDFANLPTLGSTGPVDRWSTFFRYITSGFADPIGRPLSMFSFLIDGRDWPTDPYPFKRTNLILHLLNGVLLAVVLRKLGCYASVKASRRNDMAAVLGAACWLLHPLLVSTTLYVIQREAMLPVSFTLLGFIAWLHGRDTMLQGRKIRGVSWILLGLGLGTVLAVLSKANGILLPMLALTVEYAFLRPLSTNHKNKSSDSARTVTSSKAKRDDITVVAFASISRDENTRCYQLAMLIFGWLPSTVVLGYLLQQGWSGMLHGISSVRPWTLGQRLLTEPRILVDYLRLLWLPRQSTPGLFNDHINVSTSLISPSTTLPAIFVVIALIIGGWAIRRRYPAVALALLFYFVAQLLESSTLALELYFEHRNYLPALFMFWPLSLWLCEVPKQGSLSPNQRPTNAVAAINVMRFKLFLVLFILLGLTMLTRARAELWGNVQDQALLWATLNPDSPRAQANAVQSEIQAGHPELAAARLRRALVTEPGEIQLALNLFAAECAMGNVPPSTMFQVKTALSTTRDPGTLLSDWFERAIEESASPTCPQIELASVESLLDSAKTNPHLMNQAGRRQDIDYVQGEIALARGDGDSALTNFNLALDQQVRETAAFKQAALLGSKGFPLQGLAHLDHYEHEKAQTRSAGFGMPSIHQWVLRYQRYWPKELDGLRATLKADAAKQATGRK